MERHKILTFILLLGVAAIFFFLLLLSHSGYFEMYHIEEASYVNSQKHNGNWKTIENTRFAMFILKDSNKRISNDTISWIYGREYDGKFRDPGKKDDDVDTTYNAVVALNYVNRIPAQGEKTVEWLKYCQNYDGGFGYSIGEGSNMMATYHAIKALHLLGSEPDDVEGAIRWINERQNTDGGFAVSHEYDDSLMMSTYYAVSALDVMGEQPGRSYAVIRYVKSLQSYDGGFFGSRNPDILKKYFILGGDADMTPQEEQALGRPNIGWTSDAVRILEILGTSPENTTSAVKWIKKCRKPDGGYGWEPGGLSDVAATYDAYVALKTLENLE